MALADSNTVYGSPCSVESDLSMQMKDPHHAPTPLPQLHARAHSPKYRTEWKTRTWGVALKLRIEMVDPNANLFSRAQWERDCKNLSQTIAQIPNNTSVYQLAFAKDGSNGRLDGAARLMAVNR